MSANISYLIRIRYVGNTYLILPARPNVVINMLLLLLSHFSRVQLCATP